MATKHSAPNKPGVNDHVLAALTRPMDVEEIMQATGYGKAQVGRAITELFELRKIGCDERGWNRINPVTGNIPKPTRTVAEYEAMENGNGNGGTVPAVEPIDRGTQILPRVAIGNIRESRINPRQTFDAQRLEELAESIRRHGVIEPLILRPNPDGANPPFELLAGARRFRACQLAGVEQVPAVVRRGVGDAEALAIMLAENDDRADLNPVERARAYQSLQDSGYTQQQIAERIKRSQPVVANTMRLLSLPEGLQSQVAAGTLSESHGRALLRHPESIRDALAAHAVARSIPSRAIDVETAKLEWGVVYALRDAGAVRLYPQFELCKNCPHDALINSGAGPAANSGWCVNPACYDEQDAARKLAIETANQRVLSEARDQEAVAGRIPADGGLPTVAQLREQHPDYRLVPTVPPAGCSGECECRRQAQQSTLDGRIQIIPVCINPEQLRSLQHAQSASVTERMRQDQAEREQEEQEGREGLIAAIQARADDPALLVAAVGRLIWTGEMDLVPEVLARLVPGVDLDFDEYAVVMDALAGLPPATLIRIAGELALLEPDDAGDTISQWFQARPAATGLAGGAEDAGRLQIELRNVRGQLEQAQNLLQGGTLDERATRWTAENARLLKEAREQVEARERTIAGLNKQIEHMRQARERTETPAPAPRVADELMMGMRMKVVGAVRNGLIGTVAEVSHYRDFYLIHPDGMTRELYTDEWFCVNDLEPAPKPEAPADPEPEPISDTWNDGHSVYDNHSRDILDAIGKGAVDLAAICERTVLSRSTAAAVLVRMERDGLIVQGPQNHFSLPPTVQDPASDPAEIEVEGDLIEGGAFVSVIRSVMYPDRIGAVGRVASLPTVTGRVVVHFEDGEERSFSLSDLQREAVVDDLDTPGPDFALDYAGGMKHQERSVWDGGKPAECLRCGKAIGKGRRFVQTVSRAPIHATCLTAEERAAFEGRDPIRPVSPAGFDTPGGGPDVHVMFGCASCGATADASDHESDAGDWLTESLCPRCGLAETEETANA